MHGLRCRLNFVGVRFSGTELFRLSFHKQFLLPVFAARDQLRLSWAPHTRGDEDQSQFERSDAQQTAGVGIRGLDVKPAKNGESLTDCNGRIASSPRVRCASSATRICWPPWVPPAQEAALRFRSLTAVTELLPAPICMLLSHSICRQLERSFLHPTLQTAPGSLCRLQAFESFREPSWQRSKGSICRALQFRNLADQRAAKDDAVYDSQAES